MVAGCHNRIFLVVIHCCCQRCSFLFVLGRLLWCVVLISKICLKARTPAASSSMVPRRATTTPMPLHRQRRVGLRGPHSRSPRGSDPAGPRRSIARSRAPPWDSPLSLRGSWRRERRARAGEWGVRREAGRMVGWSLKVEPHINLLNK